MSDSVFFVSDVISFDTKPALLGAETNGAAAQRIYGLFVEGEMSRYNDEVVSSFFLKAKTTPGTDKSETEPRHSDHLIFASSPDRIETILGNIANASVIPNYRQSLPGRFDVYRNTAQMDFNEEASEGCHEGMLANIRSADGRFDIRFTTATDTLKQPKETIATVIGSLSADGLDKALKAVSDLNEWVRDTRFRLEKEAKEEITLKTPSA